MENLSPREERVFSLLKQGRTYKQVAKFLNLTLSNLHCICWRIRKKTGCDTKDQAQLRATTTRHTLHRRRVTPAQLEILQLVAEGMTHAQIARALHKQPQTVSTQAADGFRRIGITELGQARRERLRTILGLPPTPPQFPGLHAAPSDPRENTIDDPFFN